MKAYELSFDDIWEWIKNDDNIDLKSIQAHAVFNFWDNLARAKGKKEAAFYASLFFWWKETDNLDDIPAGCYVVPYEDLEDKVHYLYSDKRNYRGTI